MPKRKPRPTPASPPPVASHDGPGGTTHDATTHDETADHDHARPMAALEAVPVVGKVAGAVEDAMEGAVDGAKGAVKGVVRRWDERPGARVRRLRRLARLPLPYLYDVHPEARQAAPRELGVRTIDVDDIAGTAVGGGTQRGADFLPLKPFRSQNWAARWQRLRSALDRLAILPPIDVLRYGDSLWVLDGHNRVAAALYGGQVGIDADVVELVPLGRNPSERALLAPVLAGTRIVRDVGAGRTVGTDLDEDDVVTRPRVGEPQGGPSDGDAGGGEPGQR